MLSCWAVVAEASNAPLLLSGARLTQHAFFLHALNTKSATCARPNHFAPLSSCAADPMQQAAQQRLAVAAVGRTSTVPDSSSGPASTSGRPLGFPGFPGSGSSADPFGQLAGALTGLAMAPLSALGGPAGGGRGAGLLSTQSVDMDDARTREALR